MASTQPASGQSSGQNAKDKAREMASDANQTIHSGTKDGKNFVKKFYHDWSLHLTQALTFGLVTSVIPLGMLLVAIVGRIIGTMNTQARDQFIKHLQGMLPPQVLPSQITASALQKFSQSSGIWIFLSVVAAVFFGSRLFTLLEACFDIIYRVPQRPAKQKNIMAIIMVLVFMVLTPLLVLTSVIPEQLVGLLQNSPISAGTAMINKIIGVISSLIVSFLLFEIIYTFIPNRKGSVKNRLRASVAGSVTAAIVLQIGLVLFPIYTRSYTSGIVSQIAFALIFMIFFYIISLVTLIGATVNAYFVENVQPTPNDFVTRASRSS
ncbi:YihY/virulence factor BrkB family protein [Dictyobacter aurantiacus]|uniref:YihY/virulence factor BrkB family protein n=1 Tax=Dictyobacter aurantiacus TaxID=1936993 RepID=A0A401ZCH0_9CHLR|nr:YihY/virulence factor BrkB family protein [Dictyobacter aurantiacus]GCE04591.1 hypothetical protein KDAU_19200 [Dictyobacter aurantiacus]